jgi:phage-related tail fiber protein
MTVIVTLTGQAKFAAAAADGGAPIVLGTMAIGDGGGSPITPLETATDLVNEVHRVSLSSALVDPENPNWLVVTATIPSEAGPFTIREVGLFDAGGGLIAISDYPATLKAVTSMGVDTTLVIKMILVVSDTANVQVTLNNDGYATQEWVLAQIPEFASVPETVAGTLETKKTHPKGVKAAIKAQRNADLPFIYFMGQL